MRRLAIPIIAAALVLADRPAAAQWRSDVPCTAGRRPALAVAGEPRAADVAGCARAYCTELNGRRVCSCVRDEGTTMSLEAAGRRVREWPSAAYAYIGGEWFRMVQGDLDADGRDELVVAQLEVVSNGLGIHYWLLHVFDGRDIHRPPLRVRVEDFDPNGSFLRPARGGSCRLLATQWDWLGDPRRGRGMYLIGQWMRYRDGRLVHDTSRPVVARRLLYRFWETSDTTARPFSLLRNRRTEVRPSASTGALPPRVASERGEIVRVTGDTLEVRLASGATRRYSAVGEIEIIEGGEGRVLRSWLVDGATGRAYPAGYLPADPRALAGRRVTVRVHRRDVDETHLVVLDR